jgi:hypothetical protein
MVPTPAKNPKTFISYAREDAEFALQFAKDLRTAGAPIWIDQLDIGAGARWDRAVQKALEECSRMVVILSPASAASENVMDEVSLALDGGKIVIPILYRECEVPLRLHRLQRVDARVGGITDVMAVLGGQQSPAAIIAGQSLQHNIPGGRARAVLRTAPTSVMKVLTSRLGIATASPVVLAGITASTYRLWIAPSLHRSTHISGTVIDARTHHGISRANITIMGQVGTLTDDNGRFTLTVTDATSKLLSVHAEHDGYRPEDQYISTRTVDAIIVLKPKP